MATAGTLTSLLATLQDSVASAASSLPEDPTFLQAAGGISLFDTKNELFLSYLHNLVFLILYKIRQTKEDTDDTVVDGQCWDDIVRNLVGLRLYSDKGVKPLENKLRYEIDRVIQAAEDAAKASVQTVKDKKKKRKAIHDGAEVGEDSEGSEQESGFEDESGGDDSGEEADHKATEKQSRSNFANISLPTQFTAAQRASKESNTGAYRPPRIAPTAMPTESAKERRSRARPTKSRTMDEYIDEEISGAPQAMPSIGSNIVRSGQRTQTTKERQEEMERRNYEETNYVRLPALSKKEKRERERAASGRGYGGEEWKDLGAGAERVMKSLDDGRKRSSKLEQSRKRPREEAIDAGPNGMSSFEKRKKRTLQRQKR